MPEIHDDHDQHLLSIKEYAEHVDAHPRTIKRWLYAGKLPSASRDPFNGEWRIPRDAAPVLPAVREPAGGGDVMAMPGMMPPGLLGQHLMPFMPEQQHEERDPSRLEDLAEEGTFLTLAEASYYLKIPQAQILANRELFEVMEIGYDSSYRVPKRVIYSFEGSTR